MRWAALGAVDTEQEVRVAAPPEIALTSDERLVLVGAGKKAHVFRSHPKANAKLFALEDEDFVHDIAICGARGEMRLAPDDTDVCATCARILTDD